MKCRQTAGSRNHRLKIPTLIMPPAGNSRRNEEAGLHGATRCIHYLVSRQTPLGIFRVDPARFLIIEPDGRKPLSRS